MAFSLTPTSTSIAEGGTITFTITRSPTIAAETVYFSTVQNQGSTNNGDYSGLNTVAVSFAAGVASRTITVSTTNDSTPESTETFGAIIENASGTVLDSSTFTITDNDAAPSTFTLTPSSTTVNEGVGSITFTINRSSSVGSETVYFSTIQNQGSTNNGDYTGRDTVAVSFSAGQTSRTIDVAISNDSTPESTETFGAIIENASGTQLDSSTFTITDNDAAASTFTLTPSSTTVSEGVGTVTFTINRSSSVGSETVYFSTIQNQGSSNNGDYTGHDTVAINFSAGQTSRTIDVDITNDTTPESTETFGAIIENASGTQLDSSTFTITDNDAAAPTFSLTPSSTTVSEGVGVVSFTITRSSSVGAATVYFSTIQNQGHDNEGDYSGRDTVAVSFVDGQSSRTIDVAITNDGTQEGPETFGAIIENASGTLLDSSTFTITDNDAAPATSYTLTPSVSSVNEGSLVTFTVMRTGDRPSERVYFSAWRDSASYDDGDYAMANGAKPENIAIDFDEGDVTATVTMSILEDGVPDADERFRAIIQDDPPSIDPAVNLAQTGYITINEPSSALPDLTVDSLVLNGIAIAPGSTFGPVLRPGDTVNLSWQVRNVGAGAAGASELGIHLIDDAGATLIFVDSTSSILPDQSDSSQTGTLVVPDTIAPGTYAVLLFADQNGVIAEQNDNNNGASFFVTIGGTSSQLDQVREGTETTLSLAVDATVPGFVDAEPMAGDGSLADGAGGFVDKDWYRLNLTAGVSYTVSADARISSADTLDAVFIRLLDANGQPFPSDLFAEGVAPSLAFNAPDSGTYYLAVSAGGAGNWQSKTGNYSVSLSDGLVTGTDDYRDAATDTTAPIGRINPDSDAEVGRIVPEAGDVNGDKDVFLVQLTEGRSYRITMNGASIGGEAPLPQSIFTVRDGNSFSQILGTSSEGANAVLEFTARETGDHYIRVGAGGSNYQTERGAYSIEVRTAAIGDDPGNTRTTARDITADLSADGSFNYSGRAGGGDPADYFKFIAPQAGTLTVALGGLSADLDLELQNAVGSILADSDFASTSSESLSRTVDAGETVFVNVKPYATAQSSYALSVGFAEAPETTLPSAASLFGGNRLLTLADFAMAAYVPILGSPRAGDAAALSRLVQAGWEPLDLEVSSGQMIDGTYENDNAGAFVARADDALVVAFRGTGDGLDVLHWTDMDDHFALLGGVVAAIDEYVTNDPSIGKVYVTGHSLGAAMIDPFMDARPNTSARGYEAVAFARPDYNVSGVFAELVTPAEVSGLDNGAAIELAFGRLFGDSMWATVLPGWGAFATIHSVADKIRRAFEGIVEFGDEPRMTTFLNYDDVINIPDADGRGIAPRDANVFTFGSSIIPSTSHHEMGLYRDFLLYLDENGVDPAAILGTSGPFDFDNFVIPFANEQIVGFVNNTLEGESKGQALIGGEGDDTYIVRTSSTGRGDTIVDDSSLVGDELRIVAGGATVVEVKASRAPGTHDLRLIPVVLHSLFGTTLEQSPIVIRNHFLEHGRVEKITYAGRTINLPTSDAELENWDGKVYRSIGPYGVVLKEESDGSVSGNIDARGGSGFFDSVSFAGLKNPVVASLATGFGSIIGGLADLSTPAPLEFASLAVVTSSSAGDIAVDVTDMDNITGGDEDDELTGNDLANRIEAGAGDDSVYGGAGFDTIIGGSGEGNDHYDGGEDGDTVVYSSATLGIVVDLEAGTASGPEIGNDTLVSIEHVVGGSGDDFIFGNAEDNRLEGGGGADELRGGLGSDELYGGEGDDYLRGDDAALGGSGDDHLYGEAGNDRFKGGAGNDLMDGGLDRDLVRYDVETVFTGDHATHGVIVNLSAAALVGVSVTGIPTATAAAGTAIDTRNYVDTLVDIEDVNGTDYDDILAASVGQNELSGLGGNDWLSGGDGDDRLFGGSGDDTMDGGLGSDIVNGGAGNRDLALLAGVRQGYTVAVGKNGGAATVTITHTATGDVDTLTGTEYVRFEQGSSAVTVEISEVSDVNMNAMADVIFRNDVTQWTKLTDGSSTAVPAIGSLADRQVLGVGDFNGDGRDDLLLRQISNNWVTFLNGASKTETVNVGTLAGHDVLAVADFSGDGRDDMLIKSPTGWVTYLNGANKTDSHVVGGVTGFAIKGIGDFNADGRADILVQSGTGWYSYWAGADKGNTVAVGLLTNQELLAVADFNGDGRDDLLIKSTTGWTTYVPGANKANPSGVVGSMNGLELLGVGDFDGDGRSDMLIQKADGFVQYFSGAKKLFDSAAGYGGTVNAGSLVGKELLSIDDYSGDGRDDMLLRDLATGITVIAPSANIAAAVSIGNLTDHTVLNANLGLSMDGDTLIA